MTKKNNPAILPGDGARAIDTIHKDCTTDEERTQQMSEVKLQDEEFVIDTDAKAEWALKKIREARADRDRFVAWYESKIKEIEEQTDFDTMNLERMLMEYFAATAQAHKKTKTQESYSLPSGKLILKTQNPEYDYKTNQKDAIAWLKANNKTEYIKVKEELAWDELKKVTGTFGGNVVTEDGEIIPGIKVTEREPKFVVEV